MSKDFFEQLQTALTPLPYLSFKKANGEEFILLLPSIISATRYSNGTVILGLSNQSTVELVPADVEVFSKQLQEGIDLAVERNAKAQMQALLSGNNLM